MRAEHLLAPMRKRSWRQMPNPSFEPTAHGKPWAVGSTQTVGRLLGGMLLRPRRLGDPTAELTKVRERVEARGRELLYLPLYSPDLNPIEEACSLGSGSYRSRRLSKIKNLPRQAEA